MKEGPVERAAYTIIAPIAVAVALVLALFTAEAAAAGHPRVGSCTMAAPSAHATVEARLANADDFCELMSHALAGDVFRAPVFVTLGLLWHYPDATESCRLRFGATSAEIVISNSAAACRWFRRRAPNWRPERPRDAASPTRLSPTAAVVERCMDRILPRAVAVRSYRRVAPEPEEGAT
jgi:hypothetical protein